MLVNKILQQYALAKCVGSGFGYFGDIHVNKIGALLVGRWSDDENVGELIKLVNQMVRLNGKYIELQLTRRFMAEVVMLPSPLVKCILEKNMEEKMRVGEIKEGDSVTVDLGSDGKILVLDSRSGTLAEEAEEGSSGAPAEEGEEGSSGAPAEEAPAEEAEEPVIV
ncbi:hypothetical protein MIMGU_mgv1a015191mg [Erythranthe guttata]|uniref:Uncharacterized protein n=1 Tax=Erythranthe guttata TaxID=4155 RepID=A0A022RMD9_ERYGU|nr:hypothetical protein MIMGU_mgv1a015191mg [Erythranthe guttata]